MEAAMHSIFLKYFDEVARQGSIRKAAAVLNVASTSVNRKIISIEDQLGTKLFDRTPEGVELTPIGRIALEHCRRTLHDFERTKILIDDVRDLRTGHLNIEVIDSIAYGLLPQVLNLFSDTYPEISLSVTTSQPDEVVQAVVSGNADIGITFALDLHPEVRLMTEKSAPIGIILRPDHPLAERTGVTIEDLEGYKLIRTIDARGRNSIIDQQITSLTSPLSTHIFTNTLFLAKEMILSNQGVGLYTKIGFLNEIERGTLKFIPLLQKTLNDLKIGLLVSASTGIEPTKHLLCNAFANSLKPLRLDS